MKKDRLIFSKFRPLEYPYKNGEYQPFLDWKQKDNKRFMQILTNWELHAPSFEQLNDIDECRYFYKGNFSDDTTRDRIFGLKGGNTQNEKTKKDIFICSFSHKFSVNYTYENLLWAHYANNSCGVRIDFEIRNFKSIAREDVEYVKNPKIYQADEIENIQSTNDKTLIEIMTTKSKHWEYEQEYRIISTKNKIPIKIKEITLGRRFARKNHFENGGNNLEIEQHIKAIAMQIRCYLQEYIDKNRGETMPEIYAYPTIYSENREKIVFEKI